MRRNIGRRGNYSGGAGPLMTGHLQDIELQLELLKRKREMIEQQQELLVMEQQFNNSASRHSYDQMRYDEPDHHGSNRDFSHLYDTGPKRNQFGRKRQAENPWQHDSAPKRIPPKKKNQNQSPFNQHGSGNVAPANRNQRPPQGQGSKFSPRPLMEVKVPKQSIGQKIANQKAAPKPPHKDFTPSKISKPKAPAAPNKMASRTVTERKSLVEAATEASSEGDVSRMLLPDRVPSQQVSGRLELALGAIMKNIRALIDAQPQHGTVLRSIQLQRVMKQAIRERIRTVMLGKVVGSLLEILAVYREEFPEETDADILNIALEAGGVVPSAKKTNFIESEDPGEFFKANMTSLLEKKLNEMFSKLEDLYSKAENVEETIDLQKEPDNKREESTEEYIEFLNSNVKVNNVKRIIPRLIKKYIPFVIKLLNIDSMYQSTKAAVTMKANEKAANIFNKGSLEGKGDANTSVPETPNENRQMYNLPYYVKIMGRPTLPKKKVMHGFLAQFKPKSIKKHRTIHNLLFVGFTEKTDFDVMVGADGTVIGRSTLSVRICSKGNNDTSNDASQAEVKQEYKEDSDIIPSDLDGQITDLLSSIRKSEEEDTANNENGEKASEDVNDGDEKQQSRTAENNSDTVKTEQIEEEAHDEEMNAATQENVDDIANEENVDDIANEENVDDIANKEHMDDIANKEKLDTNSASQEDFTNDIDTQNSKPADNSEAQNQETTDEAITENPEVSNGTEKTDETEHEEKSEATENEEKWEATEKEEDSQETNEVEAQMETQPNETAPAKTDEQSDDKVGELKVSGRSTPSRMSARLANVTPSTIRTRRASRLASQN